MTEAQNMDISLMKLALQRIGNDSICIVERRLQYSGRFAAVWGETTVCDGWSEVFRGNDIYGESS